MSNARRLAQVIAAPEEIAVSRDEMCEAIVAMRTEIEEYRRRSELNPLSGYSCNGINVWGDEKSMKAVRDAFFRVPFLEQVNDELRRRLEAAESRARSLLERQP